jgi:hypothetical protein
MIFAVRAENVTPPRIALSVSPRRTLTDANERNADLRVGFRDAALLMTWRSINVAGHGRDVRPVFLSPYRVPIVNSFKRVAIFFC